MKSELRIYGVMVSPFREILKTVFQEKYGSESIKTIIESKEQLIPIGFADLNSLESAAPGMMRFAETVTEGARELHRQFGSSSIHCVSVASRIYISGTRKDFLYADMGDRKLAATLNTILDKSEYEIDEKKIVQLIDSLVGSKCLLLEVYAFVSPQTKTILTTVMSAYATFKNQYSTAEFFASESRDPVGYFLKPLKSDDLQNQDHAFKNMLQACL
ncbi:MAG: hypothetical protein WCL23_04935 [Candidatus Moraniibacteriota bacterium]